MSEQAPLLFGLLNQTTAAILLSVAVVLTVGILTIRSNRHSAMNRLAFETVQRRNWDKDYIEKRREFVALRDSAGGLVRFAETPPNLSDEEKAQFLKDRGTIQAVLNDRENAAIGIRRGILDEEYLYRYMKTGVVEDWEASAALVAALRKRTKNPQIYVEFEGLAAQWQINLSYRKRGDPMPQRQRIVSVR